MITWSRNTPFEATDTLQETWTYHEDGHQKSIPVEIFLGKPIDIVSLKKENIEDFASKIDSISQSRKNLYQDTSLEHVMVCPVCSSSTDTATKIIKIYGAQYCRCNYCTHHFVLDRLSQKAIEEFYTSNQTYQSTYADPETLQKRLKDISLPKARWTIERFEHLVGQKPKKILDVGTGSGHFVHACRTLGIEADGLEISQSGVKFCKDIFGIKLIQKDFITEWESLGDYDIITFWGVIEHVPGPVIMLKTAAQLLDKKPSMIVTEVPRWACFGTEVQKLFPTSIIRHLDPLGHIQMFTDSSLATTFLKGGFEPNAAWYFGMDYYELLVQTAHHLGDKNILETMKSYINPIQNALDHSRSVDTIVLAGTSTQAE
ncbi:class I SAM-dependent methyltransferase [PVC group bacterium]|nr:class I SAM-dependent methyltransferase [PVC group bacterium]